MKTIDQMNLEELYLLLNQNMTRCSEIAAEMDSSGREKIHELSQEMTSLIDANYLVRARIFKISGVAVQY